MWKAIFAFVVFSGLGFFVWFLAALGHATEECGDGSSSPLPPQGRTGPSPHVRKIENHPSVYDWAAFEDENQQGRKQR